VFKYGRELKVSIWQLIIHDWTKLAPLEFIAYANWFHRTSTPYSVEETTLLNNFNYAWLNHIHRNKHHWNWWIYASDQEGVRVIRMEEKYLREMIADWKSVGMCLKGDPENAKSWYLERKDTMSLHPQTRNRVEFLLGITEAKPSIETVGYPSYRMPGS
jgi:hypothetical protein